MDGSEESFLKVRVMAFLHLFEEDCKGCMSRHMCDNCRATTAKKLLEEMKLKVVKPREQIDNSINARCHRILAQLQQADGPVRAKDITLPDCPAYLKEFTLNHMLNHGMIRRIKRHNYFYEYTLN